MWGSADAPRHETADAIGQGRFQPGEVGTWGCDVCAPDGLGTFEVNQRRIEWSGLLDDDELDDPFDGSDLSDPSVIDGSDA